MRPVAWGRIAPVGLLLGVACQGPLDVFLPLDPDTRALVVLVEENGELTATSYAVADANDVAPIQKTVEDPETNVTLYVLQYDAPLTMLDIEEGALERIRDNNTPSQFLAPAILQHQRVVRGRDVGAWEELDSFPDIVAGFRFKRTTAADCLVRGGCYVGERTANGAAPLCVTPCPEPTAPEPPVPPEPPRMICPDGWSKGAARGPDDVDVCEPYRGTRVADDCPLGQQHLPGTDGCAPMGTACPTGTFGDAPPDAVFVQPGAVGGNGTSVSPYGLLADALAAAPDGATIALARGRFSERAILDRPVTLRGACIEDSVVDGPGTTFTITSTAVAIENLRIEGTRGVEVQSGLLRLDGVVFAPRTSYAMSVDGGEVQGARVHLGGTAFGLYVRGGVVNLADVTAVEPQGVPLTVIGGSLTLTRFLFDTVANSALAASGGTTRLARGMVRAYAYSAVSASNGAEIVLEDVVVRESVGDGVGAMFVTSNARVEGERVFIERAQGAAIGAAGGHVTLTDSVVRETRSWQSTGEYGHGADAASGGTLRFERTVFWEMHGTGILAFREGSRADLVDVVVAEVRGFESNGDLGVAIRAVEGGEITVERVKVPRAHGFGIVSFRGSSVTGTDMHILDTLPRDLNGAFGRGAEIEDGSMLHLTRAVFENGRSVAVYALDPGTDVQLYDVRMSGYSESECVGFSCNVGLADGLSVILSARAHMERFEIVDNDQYGVRISNDPRLTLSDGLIARNAVGIQSVSPSFDLQAVADRVRVVNNAEPLDLVGP